MIRKSFLGIVILTVLLVASAAFASMADKLVETVEAAVNVNKLDTKKWEKTAEFKIVYNPGKHNESSLLQLLYNAPHEVLHVEKWEYKQSPDTFLMIREYVTTDFSRFMKGLKSGMSKNDLDKFFGAKGDDTNGDGTVVYYSDLGDFYFSFRNEKAWRMGYHVRIQIDGDEDVATKYDSKAASAFWITMEQLEKNLN